MSVLTDAALEGNGIFLARTISPIVNDINLGGILIIERGAEVLLNLDLGEHPIAAGMMPNSEVPSFASGGWTADNSQITADDTSHTADET